MTPQYGKSEVQVMVVRVDVGVVIYEAMNPQCERFSGSDLRIVSLVRGDIIREDIRLSEWAYDR